MVRRQGPEDVAARLAPQGIDRRVVGLVHQGQQRHDHGHQDALQRAQQDHAGQGHAGPGQLPPANAGDGPKASRVEQTSRRHQHQGPQRRLGHQADEWRQEQQGQGHQAGRDDAGQLGPGPGPAIYGGLRRAPAARVGLE